MGPYLYFGWRPSNHQVVLATLHSNNILGCQGYRIRRWRNTEVRPHKGSLPGMYLDRQGRSCWDPVTLLKKGKNISIINTKARQ